MELIFQPVAYVKNLRLTPEDDNWGKVVSEIILSEELSNDAFLGITDFSHLEIIFHFHSLKSEMIEDSSRHPRENKNWPRVGIFAQRAAGRPNRIGASIVRLLEQQERSIFVSGLDAINGTPVLDIKPVFQEFLPQEGVRQPAWTHELMKNYW